MSIHQTSHDKTNKYISAAKIRFDWNQNIRESKKWMYIYVVSDECKARVRECERGAKWWNGVEQKVLKNKFNKCKQMIREYCVLTSIFFVCVTIRVAYAIKVRCVYFRWSGKSNETWIGFCCQRMFTQASLCVYTLYTLFQSLHTDQIMALNDEKKNEGKNTPHTLKRPATQTQHTLAR